MSFRFAALVFVPALAACPLLDQSSTNLSDGCPAEIAFADGCDEDVGGVIVQADCDSGDRWEVVHLVSNNSDGGGRDELEYTYECRLNGEAVNGSDVDFCALDPNDATDATQILVRARALCGIEEEDGGSTVGR
jgi:hypothetical protein